MTERPSPTETDRMLTSAEESGDIDLVELVEIYRGDTNIGVRSIVARTIQKKLDQKKPGRRTPGDYDHNYL